MSRVFTARFGGICDDCGNRIHPGDDARYDDTDLVHASCPDGLNEPEDRAAMKQPMCPRCYARHPGEC